MDSETQMNQFHIHNDNTEHTEDTERSIETISLKAGEGAQTTTNHSSDIPQVYEEADLFANVFNNEKSVKFPVSWGKHTITFAKSKMVQFLQCTAKSVKGVIEPASFKQVVIKDNLEVWLAIFGKAMDLQKIGIANKVSSEHDIEKLINVVDKWKVCNGCANPRENESFANSVTHRDKEGFLRHNACEYILNEEESSKEGNNVCKACKRAANTISRKRRNLNSVESLKNAKRIKFFNLSTIEKEKVQFLRRRAHKTESNQARLRSQINVFRKSLERCQVRMSEICSSSVEKILEEHKIPANECLAIREIFQASKVKNCKNRRYSEDWLMLCLLLHMKSPTTYTFLRENNFIVLPCSRTIRKYVYLIIFNYITYC